MIRNLLLAVAFAGLIAGCGGSKKTDTGDTSAKMSESAVESKPLSFDPMGSDSDKIPGLNTIHFDYDKSNLTSEAKNLLKQNSEWLKNQDKVNLQIEGHCDERGSIEYNLSLGERRAKATKDYLVSLGVSANRLSVISYGKEKPVATGDTEEAYKKNRRANFVPLPQ